jgi:ParB family chromosome partitioning protein
VPLLKLPEDVLITLRQGKIEYTKAQAIARLKDPQERGRILEEAIAHQLSLKQIKRLLQQAQGKDRSQKSDDSLQIRWISAHSRLKKTSLWTQPKHREHLERILVELESLLLQGSA